MAFIQHNAYTNEMVDFLISIQIILHQTLYIVTFIG
jgi:hypothetical protein